MCHTGSSGFYLIVCCRSSDVSIVAWQVGKGLGVEVTLGALLNNNETLLQFVIDVRVGVFV